MGDQRQVEPEEVHLFKKLRVVNRIIGKFVRQKLTEQSIKRWNNIPYGLSCRNKEEGNF